GICTMGIGCPADGDRSLADFFQVSVNKQGGADVVWTDTSNNGNNGVNQSGVVDEARQVSGPTLFGTTLTGSRLTCTTFPTSGDCRSDQTGDAKYEANGMITANQPKLDIIGSSVNTSPTNSSMLQVRIRTANLASLPSVTDNILGGPFVDYLTTWSYHVPGHGQADFDSTGNTYYAYFEVNTITGAVTAYDGNTCSLGT